MSQSNAFQVIDGPELLDVRASQRTFDAAYLRSALGTFTYAMLILKIFDKRFSRIGLLFALLSFLLFILSFARSRHSKCDFADFRYHPENVSGGRVFGKSFVTAGWIVVVLSATVAIVEAGVLGLVVTL